MKKIILNILMIFSLFGCSPRIVKANGLSSYEDFDFPETTTNSSSSTNNDLEVDWSDLFNSTSSTESTSSTITSTTSSEDFPFGRDEIITSIDESNHTTESGYNDVISDLNNLEIDYSNYFNTTENTFITLNQIEENNQLRTFVYLDLPVYLGNSNYQIKLVTDFYTFDEENAYTYDLKLISKHNEIDVAKYEIQNLQNLNNIYTYYYVVSFGNKNSDPFSFEMENEIYVYETFTFENKNNIDISGNVIKDLLKDETFNLKDYPTLTLNEYNKRNNDEDNHNDIKIINIIQIGETDKNEVIIYTYQPLHYEINVKALNINLSNGFNSNEYNKYELEFIENDNVIYKYRIKDLNVNDEKYRYYNIVEIEREINVNIDKELGNETSISIDIGQTWCCYYDNENVLQYEMEELDYLSITPILTSYVSYNEGFKIFNNHYTSMCNSHFISFNAENYVIDKIIDADLSYQERTYDKTYSINWKNEEENNLVFGEWSEIKKTTLTADDVVTYKGEGLWAKTYKWHRIMTSEEFIENFEEQNGTLTDASKEKLLQSEWVFSYLETDYLTTTTKVVGNETYMWTQITYESGINLGNIDILRIKFMNKNKTYNLGVVSNSTSENLESSGTTSGLDKENEDWKLWIEIIIGLLALSVLGSLLNAFSPIIKLVLDVIKKCFKWVINGVVLVISSPFKLLSLLFNKRE